MRNVRFVFASKRNPFAIGSFLLRHLERLPFSHCAIVIDGFVYESVFPVSKASFIQDWLNNYVIIHDILVEVDSEKLDLISKDIVSNYLGKRYSIFQLFVIGVGFISTTVNSWISGITWNGSKFLICTELVARISNKYFSVDFDEKLDTISLREAWNKISKIGELQ